MKVASRKASNGLLVFRQKEGRHKVKSDEEQNRRAYENIGLRGDSHTMPWVLSE